MAAHTFLFTGEESYLVEKEVTRWKKSFSAKYGTDNIKTYSMSNFSLNAISSDLFESGLFSEKKLLILYGVPDDTFSGHKMPAAITNELAETLEHKRDQISDDAIVMFVAYKPDKRKKLYKFLTWNVTKHQDFQPLKWKGLVNFLNAESDLLTEQTAELIVKKVGSSMARLMSELDKLIVYCAVHDISKVDEKIINKVVYGNVEADSFALMDYFYRDVNKSWKLIDQLRDDGVNWNQIIWTMYWGTKNMLLYVDCLKRKVWSKDIAKEIWIHPFVIAKMSKYYKEIAQKSKAIEKMHRWLLELDYNIKSGKLSDTVFWLRLKGLVRELNVE